MIDRAELEKRILDLLERSGKLNLAAVAQGTGLPIGSVKAALERMIKERKVLCEGPGEWLYSAWGNTRVAEL
jgi:hypothetical protein